MTGPADTLALAQAMLERPDSRTAGLWPRAAALLARQALEEGLDEYWRARRVPLAGLPTTAQLVCLRGYLDGDLAGRARHTWAALSEACHHHTYELSPTAAELKTLIDNVGDLLARGRGAAEDRK